MVAYLKLFEFGTGFYSSLNSEPGSILDFDYGWNRDPRFTSFNSKIWVKQKIHDQT